jgi:hypothetical protein
MKWKKRLANELRDESDDDDLALDQRAGPARDTNVLPLLILAFMVMHWWDLIKDGADWY